MRKLSLLALAFLSGCAVVQPNGAMHGSAAYARAHRGEGTRRVLKAPQRLVRDGLKEGWEQAESLQTEEEPDALFAHSTKVDFTYAAYFYPPKSPVETDVEILIASPWLKPADIKAHEAKMLDKLAEGIAGKTPKGGYKPEDNEAPKAPVFRRPSELQAPPKPSKEIDSQL